MKFVKKNLFLFLLVSVFIFGFVLRLYKLKEIPPSLNWDEVSHGYNAYSILKTGKDEWGIKLPLIFRAYGDYKLPLYIYLTVISELFFGLTPLAVRLVSILSGVGLTILAYLIALKIVKKEFALLAAFLTAVSPWSLFLSRVAVEANLGAFLFALGMYFFICWTENSKIKNLLITTLFWGLSLFAYNSNRILVPLWILIILILIIVRKKVKQFIIPGIVFLIFFALTLSQFFDNSAKARFDWVSLVDQGVVNKIIEQRETSSLPKTVSKIIYNRPVYILVSSIKNYLLNLSPNYLFFRGGSHYQFSLPDHELLYLVTGPFLLLGLLTSWRKKYKMLIVGWFLVAFIPSAITKDAPHVLRSILILPTPMILTALGLQWLTEKISPRSIFKGQLLIWVLMFAVSVSFYRWWLDYQNVYPKAYSWAWQYGYKEAVNYVKENYDKYDQIFFSKRYGEPHEFIIFYWPFDPKVSHEKRVWDFHANWYWVNEFDKFVFVNDWEVVGRVECKIKEKCLLITSPENYPPGWNKIKTINFLDGKSVFEILEK